MRRTIMVLTPVLVTLVVAAFCEQVVAKEMHTIVPGWANITCLFCLLFVFPLGGTFIVLPGSAILAVEVVLRLQKWIEAWRNRHRDLLVLGSLLLFVMLPSSGSAQQAAETIGDAGRAIGAAKYYALEREVIELRAQLAACKSRASTASTTPTTRQLSEIRAQVLLRRAQKGTIVKLNVNRFGACYYAVSKNEGGNAEVYSVGTRPGQILYEEDAMEQYRGFPYNIIRLYEIEDIYFAGSREWTDAVIHFMRGE